MLKKIVYTIMLSGIYLNSYATFSSGDIIPIGVSIADTNFSLDSLLSFIKDSIFGLLLVISLGVFLYIGVKLISAKGNAEEFKKAMQAFIYAVIGIFFVIAAWVIVKLVVGLDIS